MGCNSGPNHLYMDQFGPKSDFSGTSTLRVLQPNRLESLYQKHSTLNAKKPLHSGQLLQPRKGFSKLPRPCRLPNWESHNFMGKPLGPESCMSLLYKSASDLNPEPYFEQPHRVCKKARKLFVGSAKHRGREVCQGASPRRDRVPYTYSNSLITNSGGAPYTPCSYLEPLGYVWALGMLIEAVVRIIRGGNDYLVLGHLNPIAFSLGLGGSS